MVQLCVHPSGDGQKFENLRKDIKNSKLASFFQNLHYLRTPSIHSNSNEYNSDTFVACILQGNNMKQLCASFGRWTKV